LIADYHKLRNLSRKLFIVSCIFVLSSAYKSFDLSDINILPEHIRIFIDSLLLFFIENQIVLI